MKLQEILDHKKREVAEQKRRLPLEQLLPQLRTAPVPRPFGAALREPGVRLIAEIKKASPSKGLIRADFQPVALARTYEHNGAAAISVLTDARFFQGSLDYLRDVRAAIGLPVLRKEFIIDAYQLFEARAAGADAVLLIVACHDAESLDALMRQAAELGMETLVEVHTQAELELALQLQAPIVGINNRDLATFETRLQVTRALRPHIPPGPVVVSESGIFSRADIESLGDIDAVLVGEALMREADVGAAVRRLLTPSADDAQLDAAHRAGA